jgi:hypothetical protein
MSDTENENEAAPTTEAVRNDRAGADVLDFAEAKATAEKKRQKSQDDLDRLIERFNRKYAVVNDGGEMRVFWERSDPLRPGRYTLDRFAFADFHKMHQNRRLTKEVPDPKCPGKTKEVTLSIATWWLNDPRRREHLGGVVFDPTAQVSRDHWNLWRGFGVAPRRGSWRLLHQHLFEVLCSRERRDFEYLLNTTARLFQCPQLPAEVAVVLKGDEGCGKGIVGRALYKIMGQHGLHISHPEHLRGKHNAHLRDCVYLFADEAFYAGDKQHESILKALISEDTLAIEPKNKNLVDVPNYLHMWMASNLDWVVPASLRARRWFIPKISDHRIGDREYFKALYREIDAGGLEAMLFELLHRDIGNFDPRTVPLTEPLAIQKLHSLDTLHRWWMTCLERGFILVQPVRCSVFSGVARVLHNRITDEILSAVVRRQPAVPAADASGARRVYGQAGPARPADDGSSGLRDRGTAGDRARRRRPGDGRSGAADDDRAAGDDIDRGHRCARTARRGAPEGSARLSPG